MPQSPLLFTPIKIGNVALKNRIMISPMCQYCSVDGFASDWHLVHLGARAIGGAGLVMMEATAVEKEGRITPGCNGIWKDAHIEPLKRITDFIKSHNSVPGIQIGHAGRKASTNVPWIGRGVNISVEKGGWLPTAPSAIAFDQDNDPIPKVASLEDILRIRNCFIEATKRALKAGFEVLELHFAHGYLVHSFLSPYSNKREDQYGGSFEGRIRLALEIVSDVKSILPEDFPLFVRISCTDNLPDGQGWDLQQSIELAKRLKEFGVHLVDCSAGGLANNVSYINMDQIAMSDAVHKQVDIPTGAVGGIIGAQFAEQILQQNKASLIVIGRVSLDDPNWPLHAADELNGQLELPNQYNWAIGQAVKRFRQINLVEKNIKQIDN